MIYDIESIINQGRTKQFPSSLDDSQLKALGLIIKKVNSGGIALIQGPPGTGKTTLLREVIAKLYNTLDKDECLVYIAPTNKLVADMLKAVVNIYTIHGKGTEDLKREVRVYGSKFRWGKYAKLNDKIDENVKIVISTEYQRFPIRNVRLHILVDEASKSPLHRPFITIANELIRALEESSVKDLLMSLSVVGDPKQAIGLGAEFGTTYGRNLLLMINLIRGLLTFEGREVSYDVDITSEARKYLRGKYYEFLNTTYRLPEPTESPISIGYYDGELRAHHRASDVFKRFDVRDYIVEWARNQGDNLLNKAVECVYEAVKTERPLIYVHVKGLGFRNEYLRNSYVYYDEHRARIGVAFASALGLVTGTNVSVVTTYTDQWIQMKLMYEQRYKPILKKMHPNVNIRFGTVHSFLGSEDENIVAILGKEYIGATSTIINDWYVTMYFNEPEVLNVQLSRHKGLLVIIGNLARMVISINSYRKRTFTLGYKELLETAKAILERAGIKIKGNKVIRERRDAEFMHIIADPNEGLIQ